MITQGDVNTTKGAPMTHHTLSPRKINIYASKNKSKLPEHESKKKSTTKVHHSLHKK